MAATDPVTNAGTALNTLVAELPTTNLFIQKNKVNVELLEPVPELALAGQPDEAYFSVLEEFNHEDDTIRVLAGTLYFRYYQITERMIRTYLSHRRHKEGGPNYAADRTRAVTWASNFQQDIMKWFRTGVKATCDSIGKAVIKTVPTKDRLKLWATVYDSAPLTMAKESHAGVSEAIPLDDIFSFDGPSHLKWRRYMRMKFVFTAEDVCQIVYLGEEGDLYKRFKAFPISSQVKDLNLGNIAQIPRKIGGALTVVLRGFLQKTTRRQGFDWSHYPARPAW